MNKTNKKPLLLGILFGCIAPIIGLFSGLQISSVLGNILMFPFILIGMIIEEPVGYMSNLWRIMSFVTSIIIWGLIFVSISKLIRISKKQ